MPEFAPMSLCRAIAPCGPECRNADRLSPADGDWVWCMRRGMPRATGEVAQECPGFSPGSLLDALPHGALALGERPSPRPAE